MKKTALHWAIRRNHFEIVKLLLEYGADIDARDSKGQTPLIYAAKLGDKEYVKVN